VSEGFRELYSCYGIDMSYALMKELYYAGHSGKGVTHIVPSANIEGVTVSMLNVGEQFTKVYGVVKPIIQAKLFERGYNTNVYSRVDTYPSFMLAHVLFFYATHDIVWMYK
jgi:hypothetical protein